MMPLVTVAPLSPRQRDVLRHVARDLTDGQIAKAMGISRHTVNAHLRKAFTKLRTTSRLQAVLRAVKQGELSLDEVIAA